MDRHQTHHRIHQLVRLNPQRRLQTIDGFGVNINSKYWDEGKLVPVMERLTDELGANLFRLDAWGKSDWMDPDGKLGRRRALSPANLKRVYARPEFAAARDMGLWLNRRGIRPYITLSGIVPEWMCGRDGKTIRDFRSFAVMAASYAEWLKRKAKVRYDFFGPFNETDLGPPEGPILGPAGYVRACEALLDEFDRRGLDDIRLVVTEQAGYNLDYARAFARSPRVAHRVGVFSMHKYSDRPMHSIVPLLKRTALCGARLWMTEFGDLDQTGEKEWEAAWSSFRRLLALLNDGYQAAIFWDAFDNYHDHDASWTIYGLIRPGNRVYTPKKRYWALRHVFKFARPGFVRIAARSGSGKLPMVALMAPGGDALTIAGMNSNEHAVKLRIAGTDFPMLPKRARLRLYLTTQERNFIVSGKPIRPGREISLDLPARSIFTASTIEI